jgi:uncharacterized membrane protein YgdD (TMEM256/DUF423 family)
MLHETSSSIPDFLLLKLQTLKQRYGDTAFTVLLFTVGIYIFAGTFCGLAFGPEPQEAC